MTARIESGVVRTYPREWFRVSRWASPIEARTFQRETAATLFDGRRRALKATTFETWYPTREEAEAALTAQRARLAADLEERRMRNLAPELVEALRKIAAPTDFSSCIGDPWDFYRDLQAIASKALARIEGRDAV